MNTVTGRRSLLELDSRQWWILLGGTVACLVFWGAVNVFEDAKASDDAYLRAQVYMERSMLLNHWNIPSLEMYTDPSTPVDGMHSSVHGASPPTMDSIAKMNPVALLQLFEQTNLWSDGMVGRLVRVPSAPTEHQPDDWEQEILSLSVTSIKDVVSLQTEDSRPTMRVFRRLQTRQECLACHVTWTGAENEIRSGISVVVPMSPFLKVKDKRVLWIGVIVLGLWAIFALGFTFLSQQYNRRRGERDVAETARLKIESQLAGVWESSRDGMRLTDEEGITVAVNAAFCHLVEKDRAELIGSSFTIIYPSGRRQQSVEKYTSRFKSRTVNQFYEQEMTLWNDRRLWLEATTSFVTMSNGSATLLTILRDISHRKQIEESLREQQQTFQAITRSANDGIIMWDHEGKVSFWNRAAESILGWSEQEAMGRDVIELVAPARLLQDLRGTLAKFLETGGGATVGKTIELPARRKDNKEIVTALSLSAVTLEGGWHSVGIFRDITEQKRTELVRLVLYDIAHAATSLDSQEEFFDAIRTNLGKLIDSRNFYIAVVDAGSDMVSFPYFVDEKDSPPDPQPLGTGLTAHVIRTGSSLFANARTCEELEQRGLITLVGSPSALWLGAPLKIGEVVFGAIVVQSYSDPQCYTTSDLEILEYVAGQLAQSIKRKRAEQKIRTQVTIIEESNTALAHARDQALEANRAKGSFLATMSHELRTPLNAIIGYSEILLEEMGPTEKLAHAGDVEKIHEAGNHLLGLINDILDLSKIDAGRMELFVEEFSLTQLLVDVEATIQPLVARKANHLTIVGPEVPVLLYLDRTKVRQIVLNLLSNSSKFAENSEISLTVHRDASHTAHPVDVVVFAVKDTGIGMTPEQTTRLFQEFSQADSSTTRKFGGTGLGLAICKRFCEMMHGSIDVHSVYQEGTEFTVTLPVSLRAPETLIENELPSHEELGPTGLPLGPTVLIIDDDPNVRELLTRMIRKDGFTVVTADNGADGVALARKLYPTVVILDAVMPHRDGWTVLREMKDDPDLRSIPVIMHTIIDNKNLGFALGARDYLVKPVDHDTLIRALRQYKESDRSTRVLIVDDDPRLRDKLSLMLSKEGCQTTAVRGGHEALDSLSRSLPDVIILDLIMPTMDGFEFLNVVKDNVSWAAIPILILSAMDISRNEVKELSSSVVGVMQKSQYDPQQILALVRRYGRRT